MKFKTKLKNVQKNTEWFVNKWEWIILILAITVPLISFLYGDTNSIIRCGIDVPKSILQGRFGEYFKYATESQAAGLMLDPPTYDILFYMTVGVWELPIAIIELLTGTTLQNSTLAMCYSKCILLAFLILSAWMIYKIAIEVQLSKKIAAWAAFMFMSSGFVFAYLCIAGQYDILGIFFILAGLYYYIKKDNIKFVLFFAIAVQYKFFPIFIFIPLLLLKEKNILKIALNMICVSLPMALLRLPFINDSQAMIAKNSIQADMLDRIFRNRISIFESEVPLSLLFVGAVCIFCYLKDINEKEHHYYSIFIPFLSISMLFLSFPFFPYWIMYLAPWIPLLFFMKKEHSDRRLILELGMQISIILAQFSHFDWVFELDNMEGMFLDKVLFPYANFTNALSLSNFNTILPIEDFEFLLYGMYILCLAALIILYWPRKMSEYQEESYPCRKVLWIRGAACFVIGSIPLLLYGGSILRELLFF